MIALWAGCGNASTFALLQGVALSLHLRHESVEAKSSRNTGMLLINLQTCAPSLPCVRQRFRNIGSDKAQGQPSLTTGRTKIAIYHCQMLSSGTGSHSVFVLVAEPMDVRIAHQRSQVTSSIVFRQTAPWPLTTTANHTQHTREWDARLGAPGSEKSEVDSDSTRSSISSAFLPLCR